MKPPPRGHIYTLWFKLVRGSKAFGTSKPWGLRTLTSLDLRASKSSIDDCTQPKPRIRLS